MSHENILVVDDEKDILELVRYNLAKAGYGVQCAASGEAALDLLERSIPDLILLDLMLPGLDGLDVCRRLKQDERTRSVPVIMLTARGEDADIVAGLELGADDYITKPFSPRVLVARLRAVLRRRSRPEQNGDGLVEIHNLRIDPARRAITADGKPVELTATQFEILSFLARRPGWVFTRNQIINAVKGDDYPVTDRSVDVQIAGLRKKLGSAGSLVETIRGVGYRFKGQE